MLLKVGFGEYRQTGQDIPGLGPVKSMEATHHGNLWGKWIDNNRMNSGEENLVFESDMAVRKAVLFY
jgi:hypothetical protein